MSASSSKSPAQVAQPAATPTARTNPFVAIAEAEAAGQGKPKVTGPGRTVEADAAAYFESQQALRRSGSDTLVASPGSSSSLYYFTPVPGASAGLPSSFRPEILQPAPLVPWLRSPQIAAPHGHPASHRAPLAGPLRPD